MQIKLPPLGEGANSGTVAGIFVKVGDRIKKDQPLLELESEKAVASIPSPASGVIEEILVNEGDEISVGHVIARLSGPEGEEPTPGPAQMEKRGISVGPGGELIRGLQAKSPVSPPVPPPGFPPPAAPSVRKMARELGIDLRSVRGSLRGGRIALEDLRAYIAGLQRGAIVPEPRVGRGAVPPGAEPVDFSRWGPVTRKKLSTLRMAIGRKMVESWTTIPHVTQFADADVTDLENLRKKHAPSYEQKGTRLTLTPFLVKALVDILRAHPEFNGSLDPATGEFVCKEYYHFGIAVDTEQGLIVPVIRDVDRKNLLDLALELQQLAERTRARKLSLEELQGGTFTISNQGGIGGGHFTPIINPPEVAILGVGRGVGRPVFMGDKAVRRIMLPLALSYDHRVIDGARAARFVVELQERLQMFNETEVGLVA
jgi:pyruvate dehydrogenase E2 component (dihydrolipoamide acetyltransferase)